MFQFIKPLLLDIVNQIRSILSYASASGRAPRQRDSMGFNWLPTGLNRTQLALNGTELASNGTQLATNGIELA